MSNEKILHKIITDSDAKHIANERFLIDRIYEAMDEARKDEALKFSKFLFKNNYIGDGKYFYNNDGEGVNENLVYEQFKQPEK